MFLVLCVAGILSSCSKKYDDSALWGKVDELEFRIAMLEELCRQMNTNISSLQSLVDVLQDNDCITEVIPIWNDGEEVGYTIAFKYNPSITIYNRIGDGNGEEGKNIVTPIIRIKLYDDGNYYWTIQIGEEPEEWLRDTDGNMVRANGKDGTNGKTPRIRINPATNEWEISADGSESGFVSTGVKATGSSTSGSDIFADISETDDAVTFTLTSGETIVLPKNIAVSISFERPGSFSPKEVRTIPYSLTALNPASVNISIVGVTSGWKVEVDRVNSQFIITAPSSSIASGRADAAILVYDAGRPAGVYPLPLVVVPLEGSVVINGTVWATANVDDCYTFAANPGAYGKYYQYNRKTAIAPNGILPEYTNYEIVEWSKENDPCPAGWRLPTASELKALVASDWRKVDPSDDNWGVHGIWFGPDAQTATSSNIGNAIFLPAANIKYNNSNPTTNFLKAVEYCSSSIYKYETYKRVMAMWNPVYWDEEKFYLFIGSTNPKNQGYSVRCVRELDHISVEELKQSIKQ